ncbi:MAG: type III secretion system outer membrane ring subunit SctC [Planctomycetota bacterium]|jgi:type III secretion protein C|nr:type III secretion system outer membrane ring subunit SctC [Planctomycetota bacterium]
MLAVCLAVLFEPLLPLEAVELSTLRLVPPITPGDFVLPDVATVPDAVPNRMVAANNAASGDSGGKTGEEGRHWLRHPVAYDVKMRPLAEILADFAARQGVAARVSPALTGTVSGTFSFADPEEFLDVLCRAKHMNWYFDGSVVHFFSNSEMETRLFPLAGEDEERVRNTLLALGLFDARFKWRSASEGRLLMVQGPEAYLARITEILGRIGEVEQARRAELEAREESAERPRGKKLGVFRLKHAWAAARNVTAGDADTSVPGVADILRQIVSDSPLPPRQAPGPEQNAGAPRLMKGTGVIGRANAEARDEPESSRDAPFIQAETRINAVLVWDYGENLARYADIIAALDRPLELVEIRAAIIDVETDRSRELGFSWEYRGDNSDWRNNAGVNAGDVARAYIPVVGDGLQYATIYTRGLDSFMARVNLMEKNGAANILSRPTVLTQDNIQAVLEHTDTFYVRLQGQDEVDLADITTGLTLKVTPHVIPSDDASVRPGASEGIQMAVHIVNGSNTADTGATQVDNLPRVKQSTITTQAVVREGEALVIGGYYNETLSVTRTGVPGLSKIPGIGALFRNKSNVASRSERLFILSPRVVRLGDMPLAPGSEGERVIKESPGLEHLSTPASEAYSLRTIK